MARDISAGNAFVTIGAKLDPLTKALKQANDKINETGKNFVKVGGQITAAGVAMLAPFALAAKKFASTGDEIAKMSRRTGVATETLSQWAFAAQLSGADAGVLEKALRGMARNMFDASRGTGEMMSALETLNVEYGTLSKLSPEQQFLALGDALKGVEDPSIKAGIAMKVFGRAGSQLIPLFDEGSEKIKEYGKEARRLGITMDAETAQKAEILTDSMFKVDQALFGVVLTIGSQLAPVLIKASDLLTNIVAEGKDFIKENKEMAQSVLLFGAAIFATGTIIVALGGALIGISLALPALGLIFSGFATLLSPVALAVAALTATIVVLADTAAGAFDLPSLGIAKFIANWEIAGFTIGEHIELGVIAAQGWLLKLLNTTDLTVAKIKARFEGSKSTFGIGSTKGEIDALNEVSRISFKGYQDELAFQKKIENRSIEIAKASQNRKLALNGQGNAGPAQETSNQKVEAAVDRVTKKIVDAKAKLAKIFADLNLPTEFSAPKLEGFKFDPSGVLSIEQDDIAKRTPSGQSVTGSFSGAAAFAANSKIVDEIQKKQLGELGAIRIAVENPPIPRLA